MAGTPSGLSRLSDTPLRASEPLHLSTCVVRPHPLLPWCHVSMLPLFCCYRCGPDASMVGFVAQTTGSTATLFDIDVPSFVYCANNGM